MESPETTEELDARVEKAYAAYVEAVGGHDESHRPLAPYYELHTTHRTAWRQAVMAALTPVTEAERDRQRPQGAQAPEGSPAGMSTGTAEAHEDEPSPLRPSTPPPTPGGMSRPSGTAPPLRKDDEEDDEESRQRGRGRK